MQFPDCPSLIPNSCNLPSQIHATQHATTSHNQSYISSPASSRNTLQWSSNHLRTQIISLPGQCVKQETASSPQATKVFVSPSKLIADPNLSSFVRSLGCSLILCPQYLKSSAILKSETLDSRLMEGSGALDLLPVTVKGGAYRQVPELLQGVLTSQATPSVDETLLSVQKPTPTHDDKTSKFPKKPTRKCEIQPQSSERATYCFYSFGPENRSTWWT